MHHTSDLNARGILMCLEVLGNDGNRKAYFIC